MKVFIAIIALALAVASQASYIPEVASYPVTSTSVWPPNGIYAHGAYNAWPYKTAVNWNAHPYVNSWSDSAWSPATSVYNNGLYGRKTVVQANVAKAAYPWGQPWETYGAGASVYGLGYNGGYLSSVPVSKQIAITHGSYHGAPVAVGGQKLILV